MTPTLEGSPTKAKEAPPHEVRLAPLDTNPAFQCFREGEGNLQINSKPNKSYEVKYIISISKNPEFPN